MTEAATTELEAEVIDPEAEAGKLSGDAEGAGSTEGTGKEVAPDWAADWREKIAGSDEKMLKRLSRFQSPKDVFTSYLAADQKIRSGEFKAPLPDDATEEQVAAFRKENGIPETPEGYLEKLSDGLVIGEDDKPRLATFTAAMHAKNAPPALVAEAVDWYYRSQEEAAAAQSDADKAVQQATEDELRAEWGPEYRANINAAKAFLGTAPTADDGTPLKDLLFGARLADGTPLGNHSAALRWLVSLANDANPAGFVAPGTSGNQAQSVEDEIASIENVMRTDRKSYNRDEKMQARYRQLLDAREKLAKRG